MVVQDILLENLREECRMPFIGPLKGACPSLCPQKARRHLFYVYGKIKYMISQKSYIENSHGGGWLKWELRFLVVFLGLISFSNIILSSNTFALFVPTLSASIDQANLQVNGNQVINSTDKTTEILFNFTVNTNNRTGYTATLSSETENTALTNAGSSAGAKIDSISANLTLNNLPNNTWGYKFGASSNYAPIPMFSTPAQILQTAGKTNGNESNQLSIGMKLADNLESGNYTNKLILSFVSNPYAMRAMMTTGIDFNTKLKTFETGGNRIEHISRSMTTPSSGINIVSLEDEVNSDYEIKAWYDAATKTVYYYADAEKIILNVDSNAMFHNIVNLTSLDVSSFDASRVRGMGNMFFGDEKLVSLDLSNFDTRNLTNMDKMFYGMSSLTDLNINSFNTSNVTNMNALFYGMLNIENINISSFNTQNVTNMSHMFSGMHKLKQLQLPTTFDTSNVTDMSFMFAQDHKLKTLNLGHLNTSRVTTMEKMFNNMWALESLDVSSFDTSNVTNMRDMFGGVAKVTTLNLDNFNTSKVTDMFNMFNSMLAIENLSLPSFDTRNVTNMAGMFGGMESLKNLNISSFDTSNVKNFRYMFLLGRADIYGHDQVDHLEHIYASKKFVISAMETGGSESIFYRRPSLTVGAGCSFVSGTGNPFCIGSTWVVVP